NHAAAAETNGLPAEIDDAPRLEAQRTLAVVAFVRLSGQDAAAPIIPARIVGLRHVGHRRLSRRSLAILRVAARAVHVKPCVVERLTRDESHRRFSRHASGTSINPVNPSAAY